MAYIKLKENLPGIVGLIYYKRSTGKALCHFTQAGLRGPSPLTVTERELIAAYVSSLNERFTSLPPFVFSIGTSMVWAPSP